MKKINYLLLFLLCPCLIFADECKIISGTGSNIGDEISCGSENFYVLSNDGNKIDMLSKYNLYVGYDVIKSDVTYYEKDGKNYNDIEEYCNNLKSSYSEDTIILPTVKYNFGNEELGEEYFCRIFIPHTYTDVMQDSEAIGLYPNGNMEVAYPLHGVLMLDDEVKDGEFDENYDLIPEKSSFKEYFDGYKDTLEKMNIRINNIGFIKRTGVENVINTISDDKIKILPFTSEETGGEEWSEIDVYDDYSMIFSKFNIKKYVPEKYKWLYSTSYWVGSAGYFKNEYVEEYYDEFVTTLGDYCSYERGCVEKAIGLGLRPVVNINTSEISWNINTKDVEHVKINVNKTSKYKSVVDINFDIDDGYEISKVIIKDNKDNEIEIKDNKFVMPNSDVNINVELSKIELENPKTIDNIEVNMICLLLSIFGIVCYYKLIVSKKIFNR